MQRNSFIPFPNDMLTIKMKITGMYNDQIFKKGDVVTFAEDVIGGLDPKDYDVLETPKQYEARLKAEAKAKAKAEAKAKDEDEDDDDDEEEKNVKSSSDKMQRPEGTK